MEILVSNNTHHRSRERVKNMGEVFTPDPYVQQMLSLIDKTVWQNENVVFFEPACGHGNIALAIVERRIRAFTRKYAAAGIGDPILHAVANAIHTLWAVDICPLNVQLTRKRIIDMIVQTLRGTDFTIRKHKMKHYISHVLCALIWQIDVNETLSALSRESAAHKQASQTKVGKQWIARNGHKPIRFDLGWCEFYMQSRTRKIVPMLYERGVRFLDILQEEGSGEGFEEFSFAWDAMRVLIQQPTKEPIQTEAA